jgi:dTDP-4-dehydrorhamnose reductase
MNRPASTIDSMRILILGAGGMLGHKLWQRLPERFPDTWATLRARRSHYARTGLFDSSKVVDGLDAMDFAAVVRVLDDIRPQAVVNCIAVTKRREAAADALASIELNAALPHRLARWAEARGARLIHFSTDCVFSGLTGGYTEDSLTDAEDLYGRTKALGEVAGPGALTLRSSLVGREIGGHTELLDWFLAQRGRRIKGYRQALFTGVSTLCMSEIVAGILQRFPTLSGLLQPTAPQVSKYELLHLARDAFGLDAEIQPEDTVQVRRNLDGSRFLRATGIGIPAWSTMMAELAADPTPYDQWSEAHAA